MNIFFWFVKAFYKSRVWIERAAKDLMGRDLSYIFYSFDGFLQIADPCLDARDRSFLSVTIGGSSQKLSSSMTNWLPSSSDGSVDSEIERYVKF